MHFQVATFLLAAIAVVSGTELIGTLPNEQHGIGGSLFVVDSRTLHFQNFNYDGAGPGAFLYYYRPGVAVNRNGGGIKIPLPSSVGQSGGSRPGSFQQRRFTNEDFTVTLPAGTDVCDIGTLTIWCEPFRAIFTRITIGRDIFVNNGADPCTLLSQVPPTTLPPTTLPPTTLPPTTLPPTILPPATTEAPVTTVAVPVEILIGDLPNEQHGIDGNLYVVDSRTLRFEDFDYDGGGPGAFLYYYRPGVAVNRNGGGIKIPLPSGIGQSGGTRPGSFQQRRFTNEDFTVTLPAGTDVCDIGTLTIWCEPFRAIFTRIAIRKDIFENDGADPCTLAAPTPPPATTEETTVATQTTPTTTTPPPGDFNNCIPLHETMQLSWYVDNANSKARFKICGCQSIEPNTNQYLGFGLSGDSNRTLMFKADPIITWVDSVTSQPRAVDYYLSDYTQCRAGVGACPDTSIAEKSCNNDVFDVDGSVENGQQCITFSRPLAASDDCDRPINPDNQNQYIVWGIGGLGETAFKHFERAEPNDPPIHLGRAPRDDCAGVDLTCGGCPPFVNRHIIANEDSVFELKIGPSGNERGYQAITGQVGWGIAWFINNTLTPELTLVRGRTYTFLIRGGNDPDFPARYHPFYITNSIGGGRLANDDPEDVANEIVFAGIDDTEEPTGVGPLCLMGETEASFEIRTQCRDLNTYINSLVPDRGSLCTGGEPGQVVWTPDEDTPDIVYYQCATHLNLGWRINVVDPACPARAPSDLPLEARENALVITLDDISSSEFTSEEASFRATVESVINGQFNGVSDACVTIIGLSDSDGNLVVRLYVSSQGDFLEADAAVSAVKAGIEAGAFEDAGFQTEEVTVGEEEESPALSTGAIVGIVIGAVVILLLILLLVVIIIVITLRKTTYKHHSAQRDGFDNKVYYYTDTDAKEPLDDSVKIS